MEIERVKETINRVAPSVSSVGKDDPTSLPTKKGFVYRETGISQIYDIIDCGYVRSNEKRKSNQVWWTRGGNNSFHINKRPVLVASDDIVVDLKNGAVALDDLSEIWIYDEETKKWNNKIEDIRKIYIENHQENEIHDIVGRIR